MEAQVSPESQTAIETQATLRCLCKLRYNGSRHSHEVITWAQRLTEEIKSALAAALKLDSSALATQTICVILSRNRAFVCVDVCVEGGDPSLRTETDTSCERPIHFVQKKGETFLVRRQPNLDSYVAARLSRLQSLDKGPKPYFVDESYPTVYDGGRRLEGHIDEEAYRDEELQD